MEFINMINKIVKNNKNIKIFLDMDRTSTKIIRAYKNRYYNGICYGKSK